MPELAATEVKPNRAARVRLPPVPERERARPGVRALRTVGSLGSLLALAFAFPACAEPQAVGGPVARDFYGLNAQLSFSHASGGWTAAAAQIAGMGVGVVRRDAFWSAVEPLPPRRGRHHYRWRGTDRLVHALARSGLRWYPIVDYANNWAGVAGVQSPPTAARVPDYAAFAGALARRYGPEGRFWKLHPRLQALPVQDYEIWNEPNVVRFWPDQSYAPERLARMYLAARRQIKTVDPAARVVVGGLSVVGVRQFLTRMRRARPRLAGNLDAVGFHPYGGGPDGGLETTYARIRTLRSALDRLFPGMHIPIEITETGWAARWVPEGWRAKRLRRLALELPRSDCNVTRFIVHTWISSESGRSPEDWFGIAHAGGRLTPAGRAFRAAVRDMAGSQSGPAQTICGGGS
jgi:hypothetical protein